MWKCMYLPVDLMPLAVCKHPEQPLIPFFFCFFPRFVALWHLLYLASWHDCDKQKRDQRTKEWRCTTQNKTKKNSVSNHQIERRQTRQRTINEKFLYAMHLRFDVALTWLFTVHITCSKVIAWQFSHFSISIHSIIRAHTHIYSGKCIWVAVATQKFFGFLAMWSNVWHFQAQHLPYTMPNIEIFIVYRTYLTISLECDRKQFLCLSEHTHRSNYSV